MESCEKSLCEEQNNKEITLESAASAENLNEVGQQTTSEDKNVPKTKEELVATLAALLERPQDDIRDEVASIKHAFYAIRKVELSEEKTAFLEKGNEEAAFAPMPNAEEEEFKVLLAKYKELRAAQQAAFEAELQSNLERKQSIIAELKAIADDPDNINKQYQHFQQLQQDFKAVGAVPPTEDRGIWKEYQTVAENFYDLWKINKELRDYDFKKNLEAKQALCEEAENLSSEKDVIAAFTKLQTLHNKWREIGPVVKELREELWNRFKEASTAVNKRHQAFFEDRKEKEKENEVAKTGICEEAEAIDLQALNTYQKWDDATKTIIALQDKWKTLGYASKKVNNELFARFRRACDEFFARKAEFFKTMKETLSENLAKKQELCEQAEKLKDSTDWKKTTDLLVELQKKWKAVGPVPKKAGDAIWKKFIAACDTFFENKSKSTSSQKKEEHTNLESKKTVVEKLKSIDESLSKDDVRKLLKDLSAEFQAIGHVPYKEKDKLYEEYKSALNAAYEKFDLNGRKARMNSFVSNVSEMSNDKNKLFKERERLLRQYEQKKNEVKTYENNLGFFNVTSKAGGNVLKEMEKRIAKSKEELDSLAEKIELIDSKL